MKAKLCNIESIIEKLKFFNYRFTTDVYRNHPLEIILKIYLPLLCYLKISFFENKVKMTSRILYGFSFLSLEYNFIVYAIGLITLSLLKWSDLEIVIYIFLFILLIKFIICFIKLELLKALIHRWIEEDVFYDTTQDYKKQNNTKK